MLFVSAVEPVDITADFPFNQAFVIRYGSRNESNDSSSDFEPLAILLVLSWKIY